MKAIIQLNAVQIPASNPFAFKGIISDNISQGIGPRPMENAAIYTNMLTRASVLSLPSPKSWSLLCKNNYGVYYNTMLIRELPEDCSWKYKPNVPELIAITTLEIISKTLRPKNNYLKFHYNTVVKEI